VRPTTAQCHEYWCTEQPREGGVELWFNSVADKDAFFSDPANPGVVSPDMRMFGDMDQTRFVPTR